MARVRGPTLERRAFFRLWLRVAHLPWAQERSCVWRNPGGEKTCSFVGPATSDPAEVAASEVPSAEVPTADVATVRDIADVSAIGLGAG